jgi:phosphopantothenoylcysteine decarboxylase/phosphopantothenate--cysteine ligase
MHTEMWEHPATQANVATLRDRGCVVIEPAVGRLTGADSGKGRLPEPAEIYAVCTRLLARGLAPDLAGRRVVVSAGGTREHLDPVRFLGNRSSGRQGYALARAASARGAEVVLVAANVALPDPAGVKVIRVTSALELRDAVQTEALSADVVVMSAAVADYRPAERQSTKRKKTDTLNLEFVQNPDVLAELGAARRPGQVLVGFAAETGDADGSVLEHGRAKLARKGCDLLIVNEVGETGHPTGFEGDQNAAVALGSDGSVTDIPLGSKDAVADTVWDLVAARLPSE